MINRLFLITLLFTIESCGGQTYEQAMSDCEKQYMSEATDTGDFGEAMVAKIEKLRECITGNKFPSFTATSLSGKKISEKDLEGKVALINLWFIGCAPCVAEMPLLNELNTEFKDKGFILLGFSLDDAESLKKFIKEKQISYDIFADSQELIDNTFKLGTGGYPTTVFLNKKGEIVHYVTGGAMDESGLSRTKDKFSEIINKELAK